MLRAAIQINTMDDMHQKKKEKGDLWLPREGEYEV